MEEKSKIYSRNELIWGKEAQKLLFQKHVAVFGLGGVGSYAVEAFARAGVGKITLVDFDKISPTNINRQLFALNSTLEKYKTDVAKERIYDINPEINVVCVTDFCDRNMAEKILDEKVDFVADAIDTLKSKIDLLEIAHNKKIPVISSLGAGNRLDPEKLFTVDIAEITNVKCNFAKNVIKQLEKREVKSEICFVMSSEKAVPVEKNLSSTKIKSQRGEEFEITKITVGSSPFVPPVAGFLMASYAVQKLLDETCN